MTSPIVLKNNTPEDIDLETRGFILTASGTEVITDYLTNLEIEQSDPLLLNVASTAITVNNGVNDLSPSEGIKLCLGQFDSVNLIDEYRDTSGKLRVHQTSRKLGLRICWTGEGDNPSNPHSVGGGESITITHEIGDPDPDPKYIDFNIVNNETWIHEGYITWKNARLDTITLEMVPRVAKWTVSSGTNYDLYEGYLIVPNLYGTGSIDVDETLLTTHSGGLIYMPNDDLNQPPTAFWNATWDSTNKCYKDITPAPYGDGRYNVFSVEVTLARFINRVPLLENGFIALNSSDTDEVGHGMRLKLTADTNTIIEGDHPWYLASIICLHRLRSV